MNGPHLPADRHPHSPHDAAATEGGATAAPSTDCRPANAPPPSTPPSSPPCSGVTEAPSRSRLRDPGALPARRARPLCRRPLPLGRLAARLSPLAPHPRPPPAPHAAPASATPRPQNCSPLPGGPSAGPRRPQTLRARPPSCPPRIAQQLECTEENRSPGCPCTCRKPDASRPASSASSAPFSTTLPSALCSRLSPPCPHWDRTGESPSSQHARHDRPASAPSAHLPLPDPGALMAATWTWPWSLSYSAFQQFGVQRTPPSLETRCPRWLRTLHSLCLPRRRLLLTGSFPGSQGRPATRALPAAGPRPGSPRVPGNVSRACAHSNIVISHTNLSPPQSSLCPASSGPAARRQSREGPPPDTLPSTHCLSALRPLRPAFAGHTTLSAPAPLESSSNRSHRGLSCLVAGSHSVILLPRGAVTSRCPRWYARQRCVSEVWHAVWHSPDSQGHVLSICKLTADDVCK